MSQTDKKLPSKWKIVQSAFFSKSLSDAQKAKQQWRLVRDAFGDLETMAESSTFQSDSKSEIEPRIPMQAQVPTPIEENEEPEEEKQERPDSVRERVAWGSKEDIAELNEDILQCLEIEEIPEPTKFFSKSVETFPNVAAYYFDIISQLDDAGIDLYASLRSHLGEDHDLVQGVQKEMEETKKSPFRRESTAMAEELRQVGAGILVPGVQAFSEESRAMSWVVRTGPILPHAKSREESQGPLGTVEGSVTSHNRHSETTDQTPYHPRPNPILCPGLPVSYNELDRPNSYHGPPIHVPSPKHKRSLLKRIKNCFCFIS